MFELYYRAYKDYEEKMCVAIKERDKEATAYFRTEMEKYRLLAEKEA